ncbi:MAG: hypothetical protein QOD84_2660 [Acidobacteriaceae bacterium]
MSRANVRVYLILLFWAIPSFAQSDVGELRLKVSDPSGLGIGSRVELKSAANHFHETLVTNDDGKLTISRLPFGIYEVQLAHYGFDAFLGSIEIGSAVAVDYNIRLNIAVQGESINVAEISTLVDPHRTGTIQRLGSDAIMERPASLPGRSVAELVNSQPGWLYEGNSVLHPRGSEYNTQFVVDGIPLTDNRSPGFAPEIEVDEIQSISIYTAGFPAEFGRKLGGVVEVNTVRQTQRGLSGEAVLSGGSFNTGDGYVGAQYGFGKSAIGITAQASTTDWYLNPPVLRNYTNHGSTSDFALKYEHELADKDRIGLIFRHGQSVFEVPNENVQQEAGQRQDRTNKETMGVISYQHVFSSNTVADFRGMLRQTTHTLSSNAESTPIQSAQDRGYREGYTKVVISNHHGIHEWRAGADADFGAIREEFAYQISDPTQFNPGTPGTFVFAGKRHDLEQAAFVQDQIRLGKWTVSAGLRWDHYQLLVNQNALSPRVGVARYFESADLVVHGSYDRIFQTPSSENILLSSSSQVAALNPNVLRLPVEPSRGNYYEIGFTKGFFQQLRLDVNYFRRYLTNYSDDDLLLNTSVGFPISFRKAYIYGAEGKVDLPRWKKWSGFLSYSYTFGTAYLPVTGGLFLGGDAAGALGETGRFRDSQDQRNSVRGRLRYQLLPRLWIAFGGDYGSGLPVDFVDTKEAALAIYGERIVDRVDFAHGRVKPSLSLDTSVGAEIWKKDRVTLTLQADVRDLNNRVNLINFVGLFSGTALETPRSYALRLQATF